MSSQGRHICNKREKSRAIPVSQECLFVLVVPDLQGMWVARWCIVRQPEIRKRFANVTIGTTRKEGETGKRNRHNKKTRQKYHKPERLPFADTLRRLAGPLIARRRSRCRSRIHVHGPVESRASRCEPRLSIEQERMCTRQVGFLFPGQDERTDGTRTQVVQC